jgi:serine/threonine-protein kinase
MPGGSNSAAGVVEGDVLEGKYRIERVLGVGGMGVVVAAHHIQLDEKVALKFLLPAALGNPDAVDRFAREARAAVKIKSEHVARVTDVGALQDGAPYMVMEYLEGGDLEAWLQEHGPLPVEQAVEFVLQACEAIAEAHALGIVHRDLKPANLFCIRRADGLLSIKVLDFGISKRMTSTSRSAPGSMSRTAGLMGSPLYMSPEQMSSPKDVDAQTDIWALGVILFELLTGRTAFVTDSVIELAVKISSEATPAIRSLRPDVPVGLEAIVFRCLEKDPHQRFPNVAELALALLPFGPERAKASVERISGVMQAAGLSSIAPALPPPPRGMSTRASATVSPVTRTTLGTSRAKVAATVMGLVGVLSVTAASAVAARSWRRLPASDRGAPRLAEIEEDRPGATQLTFLPSPPLVTDAPAATTATAASPSAYSAAPPAASPSATRAPSAVRKRDPSTQVPATVGPNRSNADPLSRLRLK